MAFQNEGTFTIHVVGEKTGDAWVGAFKSKKFLGHGDNVRRDAMRRELLGVNPQYADPRAASEAEVLSDLAVYLLDAPKWWAETAGGSKILDDNVLTEIHTQVMKITDAASKDVEDRAKQATEMLKAQAAQQG